MNKTLRLHYAPDNASVIIRIALYELGLPVETTLVDRALKAQECTSYRKLNPNGLIPVLETEEGPLFETGAILLWLVDRHGALGPSVTSARRGAFLKWLFFLSNTVHAEIRQKFYAHKYVGENPIAIDALHHSREETLPVHLEKLEALIGDNPFLLGNEMSVLDIYLCCMLRWMGLYPSGRTDWFELRDTPLIHDLAKRIERRESVKRAAEIEGLGAFPFTEPQPANPSEGSAL